MSEHLHIPANRRAARRLALSLFLTLGFVVVEVIAGIRSNSLALLTDAAHNGTDVAALALSWLAMYLTTRPAPSRRTYGYQRAGILAATVNSASLMVIAGGIFYEAWKRLLAPPEVQSGILISVGALAFVVNALTAWLVHQGSEHDLNLRSAFVHLMGDVLSTLGAVLAGVVIYFTGWNFLDALVSALIGFLILWNAWGILREALNILSESAPHGLNVAEMTEAIRSVEGVRGVHHLHVWSITQGMRALSAHILTDNVQISEGTLIQDRIAELLHARYEIGHATLQLECDECLPERQACSTCEAYYE